MDSTDVTTRVTTVTADANRGDTVVQVASTAGIAPGQWLRIFMPAPSKTSRRRLLAQHAAAHGRRRLRQTDPVPPPGKVTVFETQPADGPTMVQLFDDPALQAAAEAAAQAKWDLAAAVQANPDKVHSSAAAQHVIAALRRGMQLSQTGPLSA